MNTELISIISPSTMIKLILLIATFVTINSMTIYDNYNLGLDRSQSSSSKEAEILPLQNFGRFIPLQIVPKSWNGLANTDDFDSIVSFWNNRQPSFKKDFVKKQGRDILRGLAVKRNAPSTTIAFDPK
ncbi:hypothetical protein SSS_01751 [Sarcoptes scabiei]|uniref:Uncharacterized protein n=1 Tax=Sarcoptes scabiei TaxID=52283 RepID=A0A834VDI7_SARSC|nr:hypothetical protein SSS_01751 [Sarcoptes scabiei]UXI23177.1 5-hydroxytryptamine receptor-like [Sarcoptes scabiei]